MRIMALTGGGRILAFPRPPSVAPAMKTRCRLLGALLFLASLPLDAAVLVELDATDLPEGPLPVWANTGELEGDFEANPEHVPSVIVVDGVKGVDFDGDNDWYVGPSAWELTPDVAHTVEAWVHNPSIANEEAVFAWGRRGGPDGSNVSFNHGASGAFGAVGHWGSPDIGWDGAQVENRWTYIAYAYDYANPTTRVYSDGALANFEEIGFLATHGLADNGDELPFRVGAQNLADGSADNGRFASMTIARIRVHNVTLSDEEIEERYNAEAEEFGLLTRGDSDNDGIPNNVESQYGFLDPDDPSDAGADQDGDGLTNLEEYRAGLDMELADGDYDGLGDKQELDQGSDPLVADTDQDGLLDGAEAGHGTGFGDPDSDGDGYLDGQEVFRGSDPGSESSTPGFDQVVAIVDLDAGTLEAGPVEIWENDGAMGGVFYSEAAAAELGAAGGVPGVVFAGGSWYVGPPAPLFVAEDSSRSIDAWIWNPEIASEETIFAWGRRGGPEGTNVSFMHGTHDAFGAVGHWGNDADVGWHPDLTAGDAGEPGEEVAGAWTHVAYTYDWQANETCVYTDGQLTKCEAHDVEVSAHASDPSGNPLPFVLANQNEGGGGRTPALAATMTIGRVRVYDTPLTAGYIAGLYDREKASYESRLGVALAVSREGEDIVLSWPAGGVSWNVEVSSDLAAWTRLQEGNASGSYTDASPFGENATRFYRVVP